MHQTNLHIAYLLQHHDCVIVPGLGAFLASPAPARMMPDGSAMRSPERALSFNAAITHSDGVLASSIARREKISYDEASRRVARAVEAMHTELLAMRQLKLRGIGTLRRHDDGRLTFLPAPSAMSAIGRIPAPIPSRKADAATSAPDATGTDAAPLRRSDCWYIAVPKRAVRIAAAVVAVLAVALTTLIPSDTALMPREDRASVVPTRPIEQAIASALTPSEPQAEATPTPVPAAASEAETALTEAAPTWHLIVGTFHSRAEADAFAEANAASGLRVIDGGRVSRVAIATAATEAELRAMLNSPGFTRRWPGAWIWQQ